MDIATKLTDLITDLHECRRAITYRGGEISATAGFKEVAEKIASLPASSSVGTVIDEDISLLKLVPSNSTKYCYLKSLGGMTYKSKNLLSYPYSQTTHTRNGITFTDNGDGTITVNGTATSRVSFYMKQNSTFTLPKAKYYASICPSGGSSSTYYAYVSLYNENTWVAESKDVGTGIALDFTNKTYDEVRVSLYIEAGTVCNNWLVKPMINKGSTALPYEPYYAGLKDTKPTALKVYGSNLLNIEAALSHMNLPYTKSGNSYTTTASLGNGYGRAYKFTNYPQICTMSVTSASASGWNNGRLEIGYLGANGTFTARGSITFGSNTTMTSTGAVNAIRTNYSSTTSEAKSVTINEIRINYGTVDCGFAPYHEPVTYTIPEALQGTGKGIDSTYHDTVDFEKGKAITEIDETLMKSVFNSGTGYIAEYGRFYSYTLQDKFIGNNLLCDAYTTKSWGEVYNGGTDRCIAGNGSAIILSDTRYTDIASFRASLTDEKLMYATTEPTETDIDTSAFDPLIEVEGGGSIEVITDNGKAVPTTIIYQTIM